ncbi:MAG: hypothetical protein ACI3V3_03280 [Faecousia sp.]
MAEKTSDKITNVTEANATELATVLGISASRVYQLAKDGIIANSRRGYYRLSDSVQQYIAFLVREKDANSQDQEKLKAETSIKKAKAIISVLEAQELQGKMHRSEDVAAMTEDLIYTIRGMLVALPGRLAVDVASVGTPAEAAELLRKEIFKVMAELSSYRYDPKKYEERVRDRRDWETHEMSDFDDE